MFLNLSSLFVPLQIVFECTVLSTSISKKIIPLEKFDVVRLDFSEKSELILTMGKQLYSVGASEFARSHTHKNAEEINLQTENFKITLSLVGQPLQRKGALRISKNQNITEAKLTCH